MLSHHDRDLNAGAAAADYHLAEALREAGNDVDLLFYGDVLPSVVRKIWKQVFFPFIAGFVGFFKYLRARYHVIDTTAGDGYWLYAFIRLFGPGRPIYSVRTHGLEHLRAELDVHKVMLEKRRPGVITRFYHYRYRLWEVFRDLKLADSIFFLNEIDKKYAVEKLNISELKIHVMPNAIPDRFFTVPPEESIGDPFRLIFLGTWIADKGIKILSEIAQEAFFADIQFHLTCAGVRTSRDAVLGSFRREFHHRISVIEQYDNRDLPSILRLHGILILPSMAEGSNLSILESLACGLPVITYSSADPSGVIVDQVNGMIMDNKSALDVTRLISFLANDKERYIQMSRSARLSVRQCRWSDRAESRMKIWVGDFSIARPLTQQ